MPIFNRRSALAYLRQRKIDVKFVRRGEAGSIHGCELKINEEDIAAIKAFPEIHSLTLFACAHDDRVWSLMENMTNLETLTLWAGYGNETKGPADVWIAGFEDRPVHHMGVTDAGAEMLLCVPKLKSLDLRATHVGKRTLSYIGRLKRLETLELSATRIKGPELHHLFGLKRLKELSVRSTATNDQGLCHISTLSTLQELSVESTKVSDNGTAPLERLTRLRSLDIHNTAVTEKSLVHFRSLKKLERLTIDGPIGAKGVACLKELPKLSELYIQHNRRRKMRAAEWKLIKRSLPGVLLEC